MRDYVCDRPTPAVLLFMFSDLLVSLPREHAKEVSMHLTSRSIATTAGGAFLIAMSVIMVAQDIRNPLDRMGFFATLVTCTIALAGGALVTLAVRPSERFLWFIPAAYAATAATWLIITPFEVSAGPFAHSSFLFRLSQPVVLALLFVPVGLALLPIATRSHKHSDTIATLLVAVFALIAAVSLGAYYVPAAIAMALVRFATKSQGHGIRQAT
jgi:hypothetical protein